MAERMFIKVGENYINVDHITRFDFNRGVDIHTDESFLHDDGAIGTMVFAMQNADIKIFTIQEIVQRIREELCQSKSVAPKNETMVEEPALSPSQDSQAT